MTEQGSDALRIYNGSTDATDAALLETFSGSTTPSVILFPEKTIYLQFSSDAHTQKRGFRISLKAYGK